MLKNESTMPKEFTFEVLNRYKFTRICLTRSFLLVTPRPNNVAVAGKYFTWLSTHINDVIAVKIMCE